MRRRFLFISVGLAAMGLAAVAASFHERGLAEQQLARQVALAHLDAQSLRARAELHTELTIPEGLGLANLLERVGLDRTQIAEIVAQAQSLCDLRRLRAGRRLSVTRSVTGQVRTINCQVDDTRELEISLRGSEFTCTLKNLALTPEIVSVAGEVRDSLFNAVLDAGETPELALDLAEIFGWDLDFYTDPRPGDTFRLVMERQVYANGQPSSYRRILAAEYNNQGRAYQAVLFHEPSGRPAYYAPDGQSLKKAFLRSPLKFRAPITSGFSRHRFHPILKRYTPHLATDYGAPVGTPVQAIGEGRVVSAGWHGDSGKMVHLRHSNGYETYYLHLSRVMVHAGQRVGQGEIVGLVGATGLATGPHLDFRICQHGVFRNFDRLRLPPAQPVAKADWRGFAATRDHWLALLPHTTPLLAHARLGNGSGFEPRPGPAPPLPAATR